MSPHFPHQILQTIEAAKKKEALLQANKAAARALLASISSVSYITQKKKESNESSS